jgi:inosose dehydratase
MTVRIGINPLTWTNDDMPELGGDTPLEACLAEGRAAGYAGFELGHKFPRDPRVLGPILEAHGLALVSGWYSAGLLRRSAAAEIEALQDHLALLQALGSEVMVFAETTGCVHGRRDTPVSARPVLSEAEWALLARRLDAVGAYLREQGVHLAYHHHMGTVIESGDDIDRLMASTTDAVGLLLDTGHLTYAGGDIAAILEHHGRRVVHVHCKDVRRAVLEEVRSADSSFLEAVLAGVFTVPGDGCIDYRPVWRRLQELGYAGWLVVEAEQDPAVAEPIVYARKGYEYLSGIVGRAE